MTCDICHLDTGGKSHFFTHRFTIDTICTQHARVYYFLYPTRIWTYNLLQAFVYKIAKTERSYTYSWVPKYNINPEMEISGKQTTKSSDSRRKEINKVIWYTVARKQQSHMIRGGKKSTKLYGTQWQETTKSFDSRRKVNEVIWHVPEEHDALSAGTSSDLPAAAQATNSCQ